MKALFILFAVLVSCDSSKVARAGDQIETSKLDTPIVNNITPEIGGSNYVFIELGKYATEPTEENWALYVKTPVVHYHLLTEKIKKQLDALVANGQEKIAIVVWFGGPGLSCEFHMHTVCPQNGKLPAQAKSNLRQLLIEIANRPFKEVQVRLGLQGSADIHGWTKWEEDIYNSSRDFTMDVVETSEDALKEYSIKRFYDLGMELMGHPHIERAWYKRYLEQLWTHYTNQYPVDQTIGFSFNHAHRLSTYNSLKIFDASGKRPPILGFDIYLDRSGNFQNIEGALLLAGWDKRYPIFIQETYLNDTAVAKDILAARKNNGLNVRTIMQWPLNQNGSIGHATSVDYTFDNYK